MSEPIVTKLKDSELTEIKDLQSKFQTIRLKLGDLQIEKMALDNAVSSYVAKDKLLKEEWATLQKSEKEVLDKILSYMEKKYISVPMKMAKEILIEGTKI